MENFTLLLHILDDSVEIISFFVQIPDSAFEFLALLGEEVDCVGVVVDVGVEKLSEEEEDLFVHWVLGGYFFAGVEELSDVRKVHILQLPLKRLLKPRNTRPPPILDNFHNLIHDLSLAQLRSNILLMLRLLVRITRFVFAKGLLGGTF